MSDTPSLPYTLRYYRQGVPREEEFDTLIEAADRARWLADAGEGAFEHIRQGDTVVQTQVDDVSPLSTAQLLTSGPITVTVTPPRASYTFALAPVLDSDWAYARAQMGLPPADPPQAPGGVYAQLTALAGHVARLQARLDTQEALLLDVTARVAALEGHGD